MSKLDGSNDAGDDVLAVAKAKKIGSPSTAITPSNTNASTAVAHTFATTNTNSSNEISSISSVSTIVPTTTTSDSTTTVTNGEQYVNAKEESGKDEPPPPTPPAKDDRTTVSVDVNEGKSGLSTIPAIDNQDAPGQVTE